MLFFIIQINPSQRVFCSSITHRESCILLGLRWIFTLPCARWCHWSALHCVHGLSQRKGGMTRISPQPIAALFAFNVRKHGAVHNQNGQTTCSTVSQYFSIFSFPFVCYWPPFEMYAQATCSRCHSENIRVCIRLLNVVNTTSVT